MASEDSHSLEFYFLPFISSGHMIPTVDMARLFASRGVKTTIITTPLNALPFQDSINHDTDSGHPIKFHLLKFPHQKVGLPEGIETLNSSVTLAQMGKIFEAFFLLRQEIEQIIRQHPPDCIISDMFYPWTTDFAAELGIPRILLYTTGFFSLCGETSIDLYTPHRNSNLSDTDPFLIPGLPDRIKMTRSELPDHLKISGWFTELMKRVSESIPKSYGVLVHTFYELESAYVEHFRRNIKDKVWHIGPLCLFNKDDTKMKLERGNKASVNGHFCLEWLDSQKPNSVLYVCFGSLTRFTDAQLYEIALSLEISGHPFIWVIKRSPEKAYLPPEGFEEKSKGLIINGWVPQLLILGHLAIGGFMTHTGWNSMMEGVASGVPLITWPLYAEQFFNEKLVTEVLKIGVRVGVEGPNSIIEEDKKVIIREKIESAISELMNGGDDAENIRKRSRELREAAKRAVEEGGSSYTCLTTLIQEIGSIKSTI